MTAIHQFQTLTENPEILKVQLNKIPSLSQHVMYYKSGTSGTGGYTAVFSGSDIIFRVIEPVRLAMVVLTWSGTREEVVSRLFDNL